MAENEQLSWLPNHSEEAETRLSWKNMHLARSKLKATSRTSALLSGFAMVVMVESDTKNVNEGLLIAFSVCTTLVVAVHLLALMISTCVLPNIEGVLSQNELNSVHESPHFRMRYYIDIAWMLSTFIGILLFLVDIAILGWIRFSKVETSTGKYKTTTGAATSSTVIIMPAIIIFIIFAILFYRELIAHRVETTANKFKELQTMMSQLQHV